jgi:hypothetical protein
MDCRTSDDDDDDIDENIPLSRATGLAQSSRTIPSLVASSASKSTTKSPVVRVADPVSKPFKPNPFIAKKVKPKNAAVAVPSQRVTSKPQPRPKQKHSPDTKATKKPKASTSSDVNSSSSSEDDESESMSDENEETSSEEDDGSDEDCERRSTPSKGVPVVGIVLPTTTRCALQRLKDAIDGLDPCSAPLGCQDRTAAVKRDIEGSGVFLSSFDDNKTTLSQSETCLLLETVVTAAERLACLAAAKDDVASEISSFRRVASHMHTVWESTLPQIEILDEAVRLNQESAARASRAAGELMGSHSALVNALASSLEGLKRRV